MRQASCKTQLTPVGRSCCGSCAAPRNGGKSSVEDGWDLQQQRGERGPVATMGGSGSEKRVINPAFHSWVVTPIDGGEDDGKPELGRSISLPGEIELTEPTEMPAGKTCCQPTPPSREFDVNY